MDEPDPAWVNIERFRADVLRLYVNIALVVSGPLVAMYLYMGLPRLAAAVGAYLACNLGIFMRLRRASGRSRQLARLFLACTLALILYGHYLGNEVLDNKPWLVLAPVLAMPLLGAIEGLIWVTAAVAGVGLVYGAAPGHYDPFAIIIQLACTATATYVLYRFMLHDEDTMNAVSRLSHVDPLTGCYNRRSFNDSFHREFQRNQRDDSSLTVMMVDIDHFKEYNDHYGHQCGDRALRDIAASLTDTVRRASDLVYRYGGEEFCVLLSGMERDAALNLAESLRQRVRELAIRHEVVPAGWLTVSVGVCHSNALARTSAERMLLAADQALYKAKAGGRDRVVDADCGTAVPAAGVSP